LSSANRRLTPSSYFDRARTTAQSAEKLGEVDECAGTDPLSVLTGLEEPGDPPHGELEPSLGAPRRGLLGHARADRLAPSGHGDRAWKVPLREVKRRQEQRSGFVEAEQAAGQRGERGGRVTWRTRANRLRGRGSMTRRGGPSGGKLVAGERSERRLAAAAAARGEEGPRPSAIADGRPTGAAMNTNQERRIRLDIVYYTKFNVNYKTVIKYNY
jgi:hypothetical protein